MQIEDFFANIELVSLAIFGLCFLIAAFTSSKRFKTGKTARAVRSKYRRSWAKEILKEKQSGPLIDFFRNNITVSSALLGGLVIGFGLVANSFAAEGSSITSIYLIFIIAVMTYAIFNLLLEIRTLIYLPLMFGTSEGLIKKHEGLDKEEYLGRLLDNAYDDFSNAIRALFFLIALLVFSFNNMLFIALTLILTYLFVRRDISKKSRIEIF
jgi:uncharacterized membrane protein